jgi:hypothetical protein
MRRTASAYRNLPAARAAASLLADVQFDLVLANNVATLPVALAEARGRPVLVDLYEYAPREMEEDWRWRLMVQPFVMDLCREYLPRASAVTTVSPGIAEEYTRQFGVEVATITNASAYRAPQPRPVGAVIRAVHSGMATPNRHLEETILAAADVPGLHLDLYLIPSPRAVGYLARLRSLALATGNVRVLDPVPMDEVPTALDDYDLGVFVLAPNSFNYRYVLPNKFFDFIQSGLGVLIGPSPEMAALTRAHGLGLVLPDFSRATLRGALTDLRADTVAGWKEASCQAARVLSAEPEAARLADVTQRLLAREGHQA